MKTIKNDITRKFSGKIQKKCSNSECGEYKDLKTGFYFIHNGTHPMGECKECYRDRVRKRHQIPEVMKRDNKRKREFYKNNKKHCLKQSRQWEKDHKEYTQIKALIYHFRKMIRERLGREISFPRTYLKDHKEKLKLMKEQLESVKSLWNECKAKAR